MAGESRAKKKGTSPLHNLLVSALMGSITGDVGANPDFATAQDAVGVEDGLDSLDIPVTDRTAQPTTPFKAGNILARSNANQLNNNYLNAILQGNLGVKNSLATESGLNPILADRQQEVGDIKNEQELALKKQLENEVNIPSVRAQNNIQLLTGKGVVSTPENEQLYNQQTTDPLIKAIVSNALTGIKANQLQQSKMGTEQDINNLTQRQQLQTALNQAKIQAKSSEFNLDKSDKTLDAQYLDTILRPQLLQSQINENQDKTLAPNQTLIDTKTGQVKARGANPMMDLYNKALNMGANSSVNNVQTSAPVPNLTNTQQTPDGTIEKNGQKYVNIGGKLYKLTN